MSFEQRSAGLPVNIDTDAHPHGAGIYPETLVPAIRPGDVVELRPRGEVYQVTDMMVQPGINAFDSDGSNGVTVAANSENSDNEANNLYLNENWLAQYRLLNPTDIPDGIEVRVNQGGQQAGLFTSKNHVGQYTNATGTTEGHDGGSTFTDSVVSSLLELYQWENTDLFFTFEDTDGNQTTVSDLTYAGFAFELSEGEVSPPSDVQPVRIPTRRLQ